MFEICAQYRFSIGKGVYSTKVSSASVFLLQTSSLLQSLQTCFSSSVLMWFTSSFPWFYVNDARAVCFLRDIVLLLISSGFEYTVRELLIGKWNGEAPPRCLYFNASSQAHKSRARGEALIPTWLMYFAVMTAVFRVWWLLLSAQLSEDRHLGFFIDYS